MNMKNNYSGLRKKLKAWREADRYMRQVLSLPGHTDYKQTGDYKHLEQLRQACLPLVARMIKNRAR